MVYAKAWEPDATRRSVAWWAVLGREPAERVEVCGEPECDEAKTLPTDLYCADHNRLLYGIGEWSPRGRVVRLLMVWSAVCLGLWLTAQISSRLPAFLGLAIVGWVYCELTLRLFPRSRNAVSSAWVAACIVTVILVLAGSGLRSVVTTIATVAIAVVLTSHTVRRVPDAVRSGLVEHPAESRDGAQLVAMTIVVSVLSAVTAALVLAVPSDWTWSTPQVATAGLVIAVLGAGFGLIVALVAGVLTGARHISRWSPHLARPARPSRFACRAPEVSFRGGRSRGAVDLVADLSVQAAVVAANVLFRAAVFAYGAFRNLLRTTGYLARTGLIVILNLLIKIVIRTLQLAGRAARSAWWILRHAPAPAARGAAGTLHIEAAPLTSVLAAVWFADRAADQIMRYLTGGSLIALAALAGSIVAGYLALTAAWMVLAHQGRRSFESARRSAAATGPYALLLIAAGGWLIGLPGTLGYGPVRIGWVTVACTALVMLALVWSYLHRPAPKEPATPKSLEQAAEGDRQAPPSGA